MNDIHQIEQKLQEIGDAVFQELCDHILFLEETEWQLVSKLGSVLGRDKTRKGTPDTFFINTQGHYVFVEYSTNLTDKDKKLSEDIRKCLDPSITGGDSDAKTVFRSACRSENYRNPFRVLTEGIFITR